MVDQLKEEIELFGEEVDDTVTIPVNNNLMVVDDNCEQLDIKGVKYYTWWLQSYFTL